MMILFVDRGNTDRSPMAEAFCNNMAKGKHTATSAGLAPDDDKASEAAGRAMRDKNLDLSSHKPRKVMQKTINDADLVVFLSPSVRQDIVLSIPSDKSRVWSIEDPFNYREDQSRYNLTRDSIENHIRRLLEEIDS